LKERLREFLQEETVNFQAVKTCKESRDPDLRQKVKRVWELTNHARNLPIVVAPNEVGPVSLKRCGGRTRARSGHPTESVRPTSWPWGSAT
jgi:hypothetical protein